MKDVAALAGFAPATVSLALRNSRALPQATRDAIWVAARRLRYQRNPLVAALMATRRGNRPVEQHTALALVTSHPAHDPWRAQRTFTELAQGAEDRAAGLGYQLEEFSLCAAGMTGGRLRQVLRARNIHGLLINPLPHNERNLALDVSDFAVIGLGASIQSPTIERVSNDHFQSILLAMAECHRLGYRRVGLVVSREMSERLENRWLSGYLLAQHRLEPAGRVAPLMPPATSEIFDALPAWVRREKPDAVIFGWFDLPYQMRLPRSLGLVALSVYHLAGPLSGIFQDSRAIGAVAIDHLIARIQNSNFGPDATARLHLQQGRWVPGQTAPGRGRNRPLLPSVDPRGIH